MNEGATTKRRQLTPEQKAKSVKEALTTDIGVSGASRCEKCFRGGASRARLVTGGARR